MHAVLDMKRLFTLTPVPVFNSCEIFIMFVTINIHLFISFDSNHSMAYRSRETQTRPHWPCDEPLRFMSRVLTSLRSSSARNSQK